MSTQWLNREHCICCNIFDQYTYIHAASFILPNCNICLPSMGCHITTLTLEFIVLIMICHIHIFWILPELTGNCCNHTVHQLSDSCATSKKLCWESSVFVKGACTSLAQMICLQTLFRKFWDEIFGLVMNRQ
jgi:hypothetical protein